MLSAHDSAAAASGHGRHGLRITFKDLTYTVKSNVEKGQTVTLLNSVSGYLQPYEMTALMGPSGSGKTTLLDILAGRKTVGKITGDIRFGGFPPSLAFLRRYTGSFLLFWLVYLLVLSNGVLLGYLVAAISPNMHAANALLPAYVFTLLFTAGDLATLDSIPAYWLCYSRINFLRYAWTALMVNQYENHNPIFTDNKLTLDYYGVEGANKWANMAYQFIFFAAFTLLSYLALSYMKHAKR